MGDVRQEIALYNKSTIEILYRIILGGGIMRRVVVDMQNALFADAISSALKNFDSDFSVYQSEAPEQTTEMCFAYTPWKLEERMKIRDEVKAQLPNCKIVLVVDENTEKKLADKVRQAKKDGLVDNFIYGSVSSTYLSAVIDTL